MPAPPTVDRPAVWPVRLALAAAFALAWRLVDAGQDAPWIDDWVYAWSVEHLLATGRLAVLPYSAIYPVGQVLWAAPFAWAAGFSFTALRCSTLALAVIGCGALYATLRDLGTGRGAALVGTAALVVHPVFFAMSFSFMTEVPFVSLSMAALRWYVRAAIRHDARATWIAGAWAGWAFLVRPLGLLVPLAALPVLLWRAPGERRRAHAAALAVTLGGMAALQLLLPQWLGPLDWAAIRRGYLDWWFTVPPRHYAAWTVEVLVQAAFPLAPLVVVAAVAAGRWRSMCAAAIALPAAAWFLGGEVPTPMPHGQTWSLNEISARAMLPGGVPGHPWAMAAQPWMTTLGAIVGGALVAVLWPRFQRRRSGGAGDDGLAVIYIYGALQLAATHVLWLYNDRYYLVLAPVVAVLAGRVLEARPRAHAVAIVAFVPWLTIAVTGTRDMLSVNHVAAEAVRRLEASGVAPHLVDAGYALNGWRLYAHAERLPAGVDRATGVSRVTSSTTPAGSFVIATRASEGRSVVGTLPLPAVTWQSTSQLYVVRR